MQPRVRKTLRGARAGHEAARLALAGEQSNPASPGHEPTEDRSSASSGTRAWLTPILVDYFSRDGSTFLMRLLATAPQVAVEPPYPYERKYFAYLHRWARLLDRTEWDRDRWNPTSLASLTQESRDSLIGPPPWVPRRAFDGGPDDGALSRRSFELAWSEFSVRATRLTQALHDSLDEPVLYYAEKHLHSWKVDLDALPPIELIALVRDPRDTYLSIEAFNAKRGEGVPMIGRVAGQPEERWGARFLETQRARLRWIARLEDDGGFVVRYEELVTETPALARRLSERLSIEVDPEVAWADAALRDEHVTAESPAASIDRWRTELSAEQRGWFARELGDELEALGFASN